MHDNTFDIDKLKKLQNEYLSEPLYQKEDEIREIDKIYSIDSYSPEEIEKIRSEGNLILESFSQIKETDPSGQDAHMLVQLWQHHITKYFYPCTLALLEDLGRKYAEDFRFIASIDTFGDGTAEFIILAIEKYCKQEKIRAVLQRR